MVHSKHFQVIYHRHIRLMLHFVATASTCAIFCAGNTAVMGKKVLGVDPCVLFLLFFLVKTRRGRTEEGLDSHAASHPAKVPLWQPNPLRHGGGPAAAAGQVLVGHQKAQLTACVYPWALVLPPPPVFLYRRSIWLLWLDCFDWLLDWFDCISNRAAQRSVFDFLPFLIPLFFGLFSRNAYNWTSACKAMYIIVVGKKSTRGWATFFVVVDPVGQNEA